MKSLKRLKYLILAILLILGIYWYQNPMYVQPGPGFVASDNIERAMLRMGPGKTYRVLPGGRLQVKVNGQWLRLRY